MLVPVTALHSFGKRWHLCWRIPSRTSSVCPQFRVSHIVSEPWLICDTGLRNGGKGKKQVFRQKSVLTSELHTLLYWKITTQQWPIKQH